MDAARESVSHVGKSRTEAAKGVLDKPFVGYGRAGGIELVRENLLFAAVVSHGHGALLKTMEFLPGAAAWGPG